MEWVLALLIGVGLAAACGFRVFVPLFVMSLAVNAGMLQVSTTFGWIGDPIAVTALGLATLLEIVAYYVPWVDNALDTVATPAAIVAGTIATGAMVTGMDPMLQWAVAVIAGGGVAGTVQVASVATRAASTATTGGIANPIVSTVEGGLSLLVAVTAIVAPVLVAVLVVLVLWVLVQRRRRKAMRKAGSQLPPVSPAH